MREVQKAYINFQHYKFIFSNYIFQTMEDEKMEISVPSANVKSEMGEIKPELCIKEELEDWEEEEEGEYEEDEEEIARIHFEKIMEGWYFFANKIKFVIN